MASSGINPLPNLIQSSKSKQDPTSYTLNIDADINAYMREAGKFVPMSWPAAFGTSLSMMVGPGHLYNGTALSEVGARTVGDFTSGSTAVANVPSTVGISIGMIVMAFSYAAVVITGNTTNGSPTIASPSSTAGLFVGMAMYGAGIAPGAILTAIGASLTLDRNCTATATGVTLSVTGLQALTALNTYVTAVSGTGLTLSANALGTLAGATVIVCQPVGGKSLGDLTSGSPTVNNVPSTAGYFAGMNIVGASGIPGATTILGIVDAHTLTMSANASATTAAVVITVTVPAPASNSRIDLVCLNRLTGAVNYVQGVSGTSPSPPALPAGFVPVAQIKLSSASILIGTGDLWDIRDLSSLGLTAAAFATTTGVPTLAMALIAGVSL